MSRQPKCGCNDGWTEMSKKYSNYSLLTLYVCNRCDREVLVDT